MLVGDIPRLNARRFPDKPAIISDGRELSWRAVDDRANRIGSWLRASGLAPGDRVAVIAPNTLEWPEISFGVSKAGLILVPINVRLTASEISYLIEDSGARALLFHTSCAEVVSAVVEKGVAIEHLLEVGGSTMSPSYDNAIAIASSADPSYSGQTPDDLRALLYTSGTTGLPKAVTHSHRTMMAGCVDQVIADRSTSADRYIAITPFFTSGGAMRTLSWTYQGQTMIVMPRFDVAEILATIERYAVTATIMVPTMLQRVASYLDEGHRADLSSLSRVGYGSAPASAALVRRVMQLLGCDMWQRYGQTEVGGFVTTLSKEDHRLIAANGSSIVNSCGRESTYADIRILDEEGRECAFGEIGELTMRCEAVSPGYWNKPGITAERFKDGVLHTGDVAYKDDEGYIFLVDRKNDLIISGAFNIYPGEIERVIAKHPGIQSVAVFAVPHTEWGESPHAAIIARTEWTQGTDRLEREVAELCRQELAGYKQPRSFSFHDEFPLSAAGKVLKSQLKLVVV